MKRALVVSVMLVGLLAGGYFSRNSAPAMNKDASDRAVAFYRAYVLAQDSGAAWDMADPAAVFPEQKSREEFIQYRTKLFPQPEAE